MSEHWPLQPANKGEAAAQAEEEAAQAAKRGTGHPDHREEAAQAGEKEAQAAKEEAASLPTLRPRDRRVTGRPGYPDPLILSEQLTEPSEQRYMDLRFAFLRVTHTFTSVAIDYELQVSEPDPGQGLYTPTVSIYVCATFQCATLPVHCPRVTIGRYYLRGRLYDVELTSYGRGLNFALRRSNFWNPYAAPCGLRKSPPRPMRLSTSLGIPCRLAEQLARLWGFP